MATIGTWPGALTFPGEDVYPGPALHYTFVTPTTPMRSVMEGRLFSTEELGLNVRQSSDGVWHTEAYTTMADLADATAFYAGGRRHRINGFQRSGLVAGGFGAFITLLPED